MAPSYEYTSSALLCGEDNESIIGFNDGDEERVWQRSKCVSKLKICNLDVPFCLDFPFQSDECIGLLIESESEHIPREDYVQRLCSGALDLLSIRTDAIDWICKVHTNFNFGPLSACLSINYLDRFLSIYEIPPGKSWMIQLLSLACLSLAVKMEEAEVPFSVDLQLGDEKYVFEGTTIKRMELLVLSQLNWRMRATTPFNFIDFFLRKFDKDNAPTRFSVSRSIELILSANRGTDFIEFRPSELAAAIALSVLGEFQVIDLEQAMSYCIHVSKEAVLRCYELIGEMIQTKSRTIVDASPSLSSMPHSPVGVLDAACLSCRGDDISIGSMATFHLGSPASKRRKIISSIS